MCWILLNSKGFLFIPSKVKHEIQAKLGTKGEILGVNAAGNSSHVFGCTLILEKSSDLHEEQTQYEFCFITPTVQ